MTGGLRGGSARSAAVAAAFVDCRPRFATRHSKSTKSGFRNSPHQTRKSEALETTKDRFPGVSGSGK